MVRQYAVRYQYATKVPPMRQGWIYPINSMLQPIFDQFMADILITGVFDRINTNLKDRFCTLFFRPRMRPKTSLQSFALEQRESKAKHCSDVTKILMCGSYQLKCGS